MNNSRTREELFLFRDLAKTNMTEFEQLISISIGAVGKIVYDPQFTVIYCSEGISKLIGVDFIGSGERSVSYTHLWHMQFGKLPQQLLDRLRIKLWQDMEHLLNTLF